MKRISMNSRCVHRQSFWIVGVMVLLTGGVTFAFLSTNKGTPTHQGPRPSVSLAFVKSTKDVSNIFAIGTVKAAKGIQVSAETSGAITAVKFQSGQAVQAGQTLVILKNDNLKATVEEDLAKYHLAKLNAERSQKLVGKGYVSSQDADQTAFQAKQAKAQLAHDEALLQDTVIKAPFSGQLGISQVDFGQYVSTGQVIVSLQDRRKMYVDFLIPEKQSDLVHLGNKVLATSNQGQKHQWQGKVIALGAEMDKDTRSLPVRVELIPPYLNLTSGMYVNVTVFLPSSKNKPSVPQSAIVYNPYGNFVYLYQKGKVIQRNVTLGEKIKDIVQVTKGVSVGDQVVMQGQQKLFNGAPVNVVEK